MGRELNGMARMRSVLFPFLTLFTRAWNDMSAPSSPVRQNLDPEIQMLRRRFFFAAFESDLENWVVSSDLPTLIAPGLGALYSQLSRELSVLYPDATLPAILAISDYTTTHLRAIAESAFSERHKSQIITFLSYLAFRQDVLDHPESSSAKDFFLRLWRLSLIFTQLVINGSICRDT